MGFTLGPKELSTTLKCGICGFIPVAGRFEKRAFDQHNTRKHAAQNHQPSIPEAVLKALQAPEEVKVALDLAQKIAPKPVPVEEVITFYSPRLPFATIVVIPTEWKEINGPAGAHWYPVEGISAEFDSGVFRTSDEKVIAYLEGDKEKAKALGVVDKNGKPRIYDDARFPILSSRQMRAMVNG